MKVFAQVLGTGTGDSTPSLLLFFDSKRYLINCGEGMQRMSTEHHVRLTRVEHIFLTRLDWDHIGGLPGALLTVTDTGIKKLCIHGPPNLMNVLEANRNFIARSDLLINVSEYTYTDGIRGPHFEDDCVKIVPILVLGEREQKMMKERADFANLLPKNLEAKLLSDAEKKVLDEESMKEYGRVGSVAFHPDYNKETNSFQVALKQEYISRDEWNRIYKDVSTKHLGNAAPLRKMLKTTHPIDSVVCYACHTADNPGKFDPVKADKLGVPPKLRSQLVKGLPLTLDNGTVINPSDCVSPPIPGRIMIVVHCNSINIFNGISIQQNDPSLNQFSPYQIGGSFSSQVSVIFHFTSPEIAESPDYNRWLHHFDPNVHHIFLNQKHCPKSIIFNSSALNQVRLNTLHDRIFRSYHYCNEPEWNLPVFPISNEDDSSSSGSSSSSTTKPKYLKVDYALPMLKFHLSPQSAVGMDKSEVKLLELDSKAIMEPFLNTHPSFPANLATLKAYIDQDEKKRARETPQVDPFELAFLGTGAAIPSKYRNVSSTYISVDGYGGVLFDAGEGTYGQLTRLYGVEGTDQIIKSLQLIFISHIHADHHLGVFSILKRRQYLSELENSSNSNNNNNIRNSHQMNGMEPIHNHYDSSDPNGHHLLTPNDLLEISSHHKSSSSGIRLSSSCTFATSSYPVTDPILIIAPPQYIHWIQEYSQVESFNYIIYSSYDLIYPSNMTGQGSYDDPKRASVNDLLMQRLGFSDVRLVPVIHCHDAFGITMTHKEGWKIVFSGDTRPSPALDAAGEEATLLIHEATFEDQLQKEAIEKNHATTIEAIQSAINMRAKFLMLTHFSQRYPKIPVFDDRYTSTTAVAFDLMTARLTDFSVLANLLACLKDLFDTTEEEQQESGDDDYEGSSAKGNKCVSPSIENPPPNKKQKKK